MHLSIGKGGFFSNMPRLYSTAAPLGSTSSVPDITNVRDQLKRKSHGHELINVSAKVFHTATGSDNMDCRALAPGTDISF